MRQIGIQLLQLKMVTLLIHEDMNDDAVQIHQHPAGFTVSFHRTNFVSVFTNTVLDIIGNRMCLPYTRRTADHNVINKGIQLAKIIQQWAFPFFSSTAFCTMLNNSSI